MSTSPRDNVESGMAGWLIAAIEVVGHLAGVALVAAVIAVATLSWGGAADTLVYLVRIPELADRSAGAVGGLLAVSVFFWAVGVGLFRSWRSPSGSAVLAPSGEAAAGTIITEFLIVLPIFLLLSFGMAQLAINSLAGVMANIAAYQSSRSVWVWNGERGKSRAGTRVDREDVRRRAKVAAAMAMTPVAPGEFISDPRISGPEAAAGTALILQHVPAGHAAKKIIDKNVSRALKGAGMKNRAGNFSSGQFAQVLAAVSAGRRGTGSSLTMNRALDASSFPVRTAKKWVHAVGVTDVEIIHDRAAEEIGARVTYLHHQAMPVVGALFGKQKSKIKSMKQKLAAGNMPSSKVTSSQVRGGYYTAIQREFTWKKQTYRANPRTPDPNRLTTGGSGGGGAKGKAKSKVPIPLGF